MKRTTAAARTTTTTKTALTATTLLALAALWTGAAHAGTATFEVKLAGDVKWQGACAVDVYASGGLDVVKSGDAAAPMSLDAGSYDAVVACPSDEGVVKKAASFAVAEVGKRGDEVKVAVALEPGFLLVNVVRFDTPTRAEVTIFDDKGHELAVSKERAIIALAPGKVRVLAKVEDEKLGRPVFGNAQAVITAKQKSTATVDTTDGELLVTLTDNGRKAGGVAALREPGQKTRLMELHAGEKGHAPPGSYDLVTQLDDTHDFSELVTKGVVIAPNKLTQKNVNHTTASVKVNVTVDGRAPPADAKIDVELSNPGAPAPFNTASAGDTLRVAPGTFELSAVRKDAARDDGTPPKATSKVTVHGGEARSVSLDISSAKLDVTTSVGGKAKPLDVEITAPGNDAPLAKKTADADGKASFLLAGGKLIVKAILHAPQGDVVTSQNVSLVLGSRLAAKLNVDVGTAVVQVIENAVAVPAEVRFYKPEQIKAGHATGDALLSVPAGQEAYLPPGTYSLVVVRNTSEHVFSDLKVASGRLVERSVELK